MGGATIPTSAVVVITLAVVGLYILVRKRRLCSNDAKGKAAPKKTSKLGSEQLREKAKSQFQKWKEENETMQRNGKVETTLEQQIDLASRLWNEAAGNADTTATQTQEILKALQKTQADGKESIVSWKGFHVGWFLDVFCKTPYMQKLLEFGCELWFVRKVCIIEAIRQAHHATNKDDITNVPVLSGPFVNFMGTVVSGLGLEGDTDKIVKTPTTFISYTGGYTMQETLDTLRQLEPSEIVWMDVFCVNQFAWTGKSLSPMFKETFLGDLRTQIKTINNTVLVVADWENVMVPLGQIWVLYEIFCTAKQKSKLNVLLPPAQAHDFVQNCLESSKNFDGIMRSLASIDANQARAEDGGDQQLIFERLQKNGLSNVDNVASGAVRGWLYRQGQEHLQERRKSHNGPSALLLNNLARLLQDQGKLDEAEPLFREVLEKRQKVLGRNHPSTLGSLNNLAFSLKAQGKLDEAEPLHREALEKRQKVLGHDHPDTLISLNNLAGLLQAQGKSDEAEVLYREVLEKRQKLLDRDHTHTLSSLNNLAVLLKGQGKLEEAESLFREVLETQQKVLGRDHPDTLTSMAGLLRAKGKLEGAEPLYWEALAKSQKVLGCDHPDTLSSLNNLALLLEDQGKLDWAEILYREALEKRQKLLGRNHPSTLISMCNLAVLLHQRGGSACLDESNALLWECKMSSLAKLGADHPFTTTVQKHWDHLFGSPLP